MATTFPLVIPEQGLVISGHPPVEDVRAEASAWLQAERDLTAEQADAAVASAYVATDAYWSDELVTDPDGAQHIAAFCGEQFPGAFPISFIELSNDYLREP